MQNTDTSPTASAYNYPRNALMQHFNNDLLDTSAIPRTQDIPLQGLPESYLRVMHISTTMSYSIIAAIMTGIHRGSRAEIPHILWAYALLGLLFILSIIANIIKFRHRAYGVREHDIIFRSGMLSIRTTIIPRNRIQHVTLQEGPLMRMFTLAALSIFTAGGSSSDLRIAGLPRETAIAIKEHLTRKPESAA